MDTSIPRMLRDLVSQPRPEVLNFQVNDICNARCVMCNIWKNKKGPELSPAEFATLLRDQYFQDVKHVGITGGEPTLRSDLPEFYRALLDTLPSLNGASFISNGFKSTEAITAYSSVNQAYLARGKSFSGMISVDGVGAVHDLVRGRTGSFAHATTTLLGLQAARVPVHIACTVVKANVWHLDDLLAWGHQHEIYVRFRVGEFIRRLYNLDATVQIRAFDVAETKHLVSFFYQLLLDYEREPRIRLTYQSILSILTGGKRLTTCPFQTARALNLDSSGRFATCAPCGKPSPLMPNPERHSQRRWERLRTRLWACPNCIHDYHGEPTERESAHRLAAGLASGRLTATPSPVPKPVPFRRLRHLLIVGWYGTETAGDIAILGGLIEQYRARGVAKFTILSLYPDYSRTTLPPLAKELGVALDVRAYDDPNVLSRLNRYDSVVMGGGPLMDIEPTELIRNLFRVARANNVACHVHGCGIGPLYLPRFQAVVGEILTLATEVRVRDTESANAARLMAPEAKIAVIDDPSKTYLRLQQQHWQGGDQRVIRCWLRMLTHEYRQATNPGESTELITRFLKQILSWFPNHCLELGAMHWFPVGWDDRVFARELKRRLNDPRALVDPKPRAPSEILGLMASADLNLCMRFHSVVFAHSIDAPFVAIDYTNGGKIANFLASAGLGGRELRYPDLSALTAEGLRARINGPTSHLPQ